VKSSLFIKEDQLVCAKARQASASSFVFAFRGRRSRYLKGRQETCKTYLFCCCFDLVQMTTKNVRKLKKKNVLLDNIVSWQELKSPRQSFLLPSQELF